MAEFVRVAAAADIPEGEGRVFDVDGTEVAVFRVGGTFHAIDNKCKHQGGPLGEGHLNGCVVTCPWHDWTYDVTTGVSPEDPDCAVDRYEVKLEGDAVFVAA
jgi:nitrite reductase/ring-hydroxylating ferredoxin subunit